MGALPDIVMVHGVSQNEIGILLSPPFCVLPFIDTPRFTT